MDHPIYYSYNGRRTKEPCDVEDRMHSAILMDDKDEFFRLIKDPAFEHELLVYDFDTIFELDALKIATAVINGEADDINFDHLETPLKLAALMGAPRLTKYLVDRGDDVDVLCDDEYLNLKEATLVEIAVETIDRGLAFLLEMDQAIDDGWRPWTLNKSIFELLYYVCEFKKPSLEVVRLLVQQTQNKERVKQTFIDYADKGKLVHLAVLFVAAPELFLSPFLASIGGGMSSFTMLLNSLEKRTDIEEGLSLLLDVFAVVGHKLVAYTRVQDPKVRMLSRWGNQFNISYLIREVAQKKQGVSSHDDYLLGFFKPVRLLAHCPTLPDSMQDVDKYDRIMILPFRMERKTIDIDFVNKNVPILGPRNAGFLNRAIENKLSSMFTLHNHFEDITRISKKGFPILPCSRSIESRMRTFCTSAVGANQRFHFKNSPTNNWENKVMKPNKLMSLFAAVKPSYFPMIVKRLIK